MKMPVRESESQWLAVEKCVYLIEFSFSRDSIFVQLTSFFLTVSAVDPIQEKKKKKIKF